MSYNNVIAMMKATLYQRYGLFVLSLFICAMGISIVTTAHLGTSPIASVPYVLSRVFPLSLGTFLFLANMAMVVAQLIILGREFPRRYWLQVPSGLLFGLFADVGMRLVNPFITDVYYLQLGMCILGSAVLALGIVLQIVSNASILPVEGLLLVVSVKFHKMFGKLKVVFDCSMVALALVLSLVFLESVVGLREGTVLSALLVGNFVRLFAHLTKPLLLFFATPSSS